MVADVLLIIDMQEGARLGEPKYQFEIVVDRILRLARRTRERGGSVVFVQHNGEPDDDFAPNTPGWEILAALEKQPEDRVVRKKLNDGFFGTNLEEELRSLEPERLLVAGWATDFCVDSTIHSAAVLGFPVVVVSDAHTLCDREHLSAPQVIEHHHWIWTNLYAPHPVRLATEAEL